MKAIKNIGDFTIQLRLYGRLIEIGVNSHVTEEDFSMFDAQGRDEILRFLAIKLLNEGGKIEPKGFDKTIICPCCGKEFVYQESEIKVEELKTEEKEEAKEPPREEKISKPKPVKRGRPKKDRSKKK